MIKIKNLADKAELYIYGVIIDDTDASWLAQSDDGTVGYQYPTEIRKQLDDLKGKPIDVHIASDGGDVAAGVAIYNMLKNHDAPVTVYIDSWAASIASVIAFAGNKIVMPANTFLMIHNPQGGGFGEAGWLRSIADWLDKLRDMIANTYAEANNTPVAEIQELMDKETWFTAQEAKDLFGDKIELVDSNEIKAVAQLRSGFDSAPEAVNKAHVDNNTDDNTGNNVIIDEILEVLKRSFSHEEKS